MNSETIITKRPPQLRNYATSLADGVVQLVINIPSDYSAEDVQDLRDWLKIVDRQLSRLKPNLPRDENKNLDKAEE